MSKVETVKIILLGEAGTGKSNLINSYFNQPFEEDSLTTITPQFSLKVLTFGKKKYELTIWDTAGQEKYRSLNQIFIKDSQICILVYDITNKKSFTSLDYWVGKVHEIVGKDCLLGVVGNKSDLYLQEKVSEQEGKSYAKKINATFAQTSAKSDRESFIKFVNDLAFQYHENIGLKGWEIIDNHRKSFRVVPPAKKNEDQNVQKKKKKCF